MIIVADVTTYVMAPLALRFYVAFTGPCDHKHSHHPLLRLCCRYVEQTAGKFIGDTACQPVPVSVCGAGCVTEEGPEECHDKEIDTLVDVPEEVCDLNPQKTCRLVTRLVPSLEPQQECTSVPKEVCHLKFTQPSIQTKPLRTEWCLEGESQATSQAAPVYDREPSLPNYTGQLLQQLRRLRRQRQEERL